MIKYLFSFIINDEGRSKYGHPWTSSVPCDVTSLGVISDVIYRLLHGQDTRMRLSFYQPVKHINTDIRTCHGLLEEKMI